MQTDIYGAEHASPDPPERHGAAEALFAAPQTTRGQLAMPTDAPATCEELASHTFATDDDGTRRCVYCAALQVSDWSRLCPGANWYVTHATKGCAFFHPGGMPRYYGTRAQAQRALADNPALVDDGYFVAEYDESRGVR